MRSNQLSYLAMSFKAGTKVMIFLIRTNIAAPFYKKKIRGCNIISLLREPPGRSLCNTWNLCPGMTKPHCRYGYGSGTGGAHPVTRRPQERSAVQIVWFYLLSFCFLSRSRISVSSTSSLVGGAGGAGVSSFLRSILLITLIRENTAKAIIVKSIMVWMNLP